MFRRDEPLSKKLLKVRLEGTGFYGWVSLPSNTYSSESGTLHYMLPDI